MSLLIALVFTLICVFCGNSAQAQTAIQGVCISVSPITAAGTENITGLAVENRCDYPVGAYACDFIQPATTCVLKTILVNGAATANLTLPTIIQNDTDSVTVDDFECPAGSTTVTSSSFKASAGPPPCTSVVASTIAASALPDAFAVQIDTTASVFATMINATASALENCRVALAEPAGSGLLFGFQQTNSSTNVPIGSVDAPVTIPAKGMASFILTFGSISPETVPDLPLEYSCDGSVAPLSQAGISSVDLTISTTPIANMVAIEETAAKNGILTVPVNGANAFAVATANAGKASGTMTVEADTGGTDLPLALSLCQTNPKTAACLAPPTGSLTLTIAEGAEPTFSVFAVASGSIALAPATNRIFLRFKIDGVEVGATSVAVEA